MTCSRFEKFNTIVLAVDYDGNDYEQHVGCCTGNALHAGDFQSILLLLLFLLERQMVSPVSLINAAGRCRSVRQP